MEDFPTILKYFRCVNEGEAVLPPAAAIQYRKISLPQTRFSHRPGADRASDRTAGPYSSVKQGNTSATRPAEWPASCLVGSRHTRCKES